MQTNKEEAKKANKQTDKPKHGQTANSQKDSSRLENESNNVLG